MQTNVGLTGSLWTHQAVIHLYYRPEQLVYELLQLAVAANQNVTLTVEVQPVLAEVTLKNGILLPQAVLLP
jgi:hypothetical protein